MLNVFKVLPLAEDSPNMQESLNNEIRRKRVEKEEEFLFQIWYLLNPLMTERIQTKVVCDFMKLVYDPYMPNQAENVQMKVSLILDYVLELKRICNFEQQQFENENRLQRFYVEKNRMSELIISDDDRE
jgi:hypothetical protein